MITEVSQAAIRVRPLRFAFAVRPNNEADLEQAIEVNTSLWGGIFNFIIPLFKRTPSRYRRLHAPAPPIEKFLQGLLNAFEPDFLVEVTPGIANSLPFPRERVLPLSALVESYTYGAGGYGLTIEDVCESLYRDTFRFLQKHPPRVIMPVAEDRKTQLLISATFGSLAETQPGSTLREYFTETLDAKKESLDAKSFYRVFGTPTYFPLGVGAHALELLPAKGFSPDPMLFYMDASAWIDIVEFWNLRALGWRITPLPQAWAAELKIECEEFLRRSYRPYPPPSNAAQSGSFLCSDSCNTDDLRHFVRSLDWTNAGTPCISKGMPRLWDEWGRNADHAERREIIHISTTVPIEDRGSFIVVPTTLPKFASTSSLGPEFPCANVVTSAPGISSAFPCQIDDFYRLLEYEPGDVWLGKEGITIACRRYSTHRIWRKISNVDLFNAWLATFGIQAEVSANGRITHQVIDSLGGLANARLMASEKLLRLFQKMAHGDVEIPVETSQKRSKRTVRGAAVPHQQLLGFLKSCCESETAAIALLRSLLNRNALVMGARLQCTACQQYNWISLTDLDISIKCERCLQLFKFPTDMPPRDPWAYRTNGPFAIENYAQGAYCVALSLDFLRRLAPEHGDGFTWLPNISLDCKSSAQFEVDFSAILRPSRASNLVTPFAIFGECKTFDVFERRDVSRMQSVAALVPGSVICFATLRPALTAPEKNRIASLARKGRISIQPGRLQNPVLVLTGRELLQQNSIEIDKDVPPKLERLAQLLSHSGDIYALCDFTQQLHLGMESIREWSDKRRDAKIRLLKARRPERHQ